MRSNSLLRLTLLSVVFFVVLAGAELSTVSASAQNRPQSRITAAVSNDRLSEIANSVYPKVRLGNDLGATPGDTQLQGMELRFTPSVAQQAALDQLLLDQQNPASPKYHQWLTPQQFAAQFGLSADDLAKVTVWLTSQGFTVNGVAQGGGFVSFSGSVTQAQNAFHTSIHNLSVNGEAHFANITNASVPSAFAGVVGAISGLHDFRPKPHLHNSLVKPNFTSSISGNHFLTPDDVYTIYDVNTLLNSGITGSGITIAVAGQVDITLTDIAAFRAASGLSAKAPTVQIVPSAVYGGCDPGTPSSYSSRCDGSYIPSSGDQEESSLDVEWSGAMAPSASVLFVTSENVFLSLDYAIDADVAPIITISYGLCEASVGSADLSSMDQIFQQANAQGQTIMAAAGDAGATDCDTGTSAEYGLAVDFPASSPHVTAMGGTMFNGDAAATGSGTTWATTQYWTGTSGTDVISSARSYIPEAAWNDASYNGFGGGGGGASNFFAKPAWQVQTGASGMTTSVQPDGARDVPDIALDASDSHDTLLVCYGGYCSNGFRIASGTSAGDLTSAGGTSFDAPIFAGMLALIEQKTSPTKGLGNINPTLYALGNSTAYYNNISSSVFHDITTGSNAMICTTGTTDCLNGGTIGYNASTGYDLATGWGSVDLYNLASAWNLVTPEGVGSLGANLSTTALSASSTTSSATNVTAGTTVTITATVSSATSGFSTTPTGKVQFYVNSVAASGTSLISLTPSTTTAGTSTATYSFVTSCSTLYQQNITASYSGDTNYQGSVGPALTTGGATTTSPLIVTVQPGTCASFSLTPSASIVSVASGGTIPPVTITVVPANGFTGTVVFTATVTGPSDSSFLPTITFSPASVTSSSYATTLTLSGITASLHLPSAPGKVDAATMYAQQHGDGSPISNHPWYATGSGVTIASLLLLVLPRKRRLGGLLVLAMSIALVGGATGCGSSSSTATTTTTTITTTNTYSITVIGTYTGSNNSVVTQSTSITYKIQ